MMIRILLCALILTAAMPWPAAAQQKAPQRSEQISAIVNDDAVTDTDVKDRMRMIMSSAGMPDTPEIQARLVPQVISMLIDERLMMQEAARLNLTVTPEDLAEGLATLAQQNRMGVEEFKEVIRRQGVSPRALEKQMVAQIAWGKVVQSRVRPSVVVTENEVDSAIDRMKANIGKAEYLVAEIFLPVESPGEENDVRQLAQRLTGQLTGGKVPFQRVANQFSQSAGAGKGGDIGWVQEGQLSQELDQVLARMKEGDLSEPVRTLSGYHILMLRKKRIIAPETIPPREEVLNQIGTQLLDRAQRRKLLDLKSAAFIERRV